MGTKWRNRISGLSCETPESLPFLGLWTSVGDGDFWPGTEHDLENPDPGSEPTEALGQSLRNLAARIDPLWGKRLEEWANLVPMDPTIESDFDLRAHEQALLDALPHLETLSHNPRGHLTIEEIREEVGRARRVSHRAVATLAAHSEDWQTRTFLGVRPRRILAESRKDQWDIYENRAVATLRKRILGVLHPRLHKLSQILQTIDEASEHSEASRGTRFRRERLCKLWGEAFTSQPSRDRLDQLIRRLEAARARLLALADTFLFRQIRQFSKVPSPLHSTNILQSDPHYREVFHLWNKWECVASIKRPTPAERARNRKRACKDWNLFTVLLTIRALRQLRLLNSEGVSKPITQGQRVSLVRQWTLLIQDDCSVLLEHKTRPALRIVGIYTCWASQSQEQVEAAFHDFLESQKGHCPVLIVTAYDSGGQTASWSDSVTRLFNRLRASTLLSDNLALLEASPLKIDSTEQVARAIRWVIAETEWPTLPLPLEFKNWQKIWPEIINNTAIRAHSSDRLIYSLPSTQLVSEAQARASEAKVKLKNISSEREELKAREQSARGDRQQLADINLQKKRLVTAEANATAVFESLANFENELVQARAKFMLIERCPCCDSVKAQKHQDASIMRCTCGTEWGRRACPECHRDYAFIIPYDKNLDATREGADSIHQFGADMCAYVLPKVEPQSLTRTTECPRCNPIERTTGRN